MAEYDGLRPCMVNGVKALFHTWEQHAEVIPPSPMVGGHSGGQISQTLGIVEREDGTIHKCYADEIRFLDSGNAFNFCMEAVKNVSAADVAPVVHGRWVNGCQCSVCGNRHGPYNSRHRPYYNYCPNCGAKMDEEVNCDD